MNKTINLLKLLPVVLLSACTTSYPPRDTTSAPELPHRNVLVQQPDNCSVGCPQGGSQQTIYRHVYTLNNNSVTKFANWVAYSVTKPASKRSPAELGAGPRFTALGYVGPFRL